MIRINEEDKQTIYITRGDAPNGEINRIAFILPLYNFDTEEVENYEFQLNDEIVFSVYEKKGYTHNEIIKKTYKISDLGYVEPTECPELQITSTDTMKFPLANKRQTFYYEIVLNGKTTIIGDNDNKTNKIIVYPGVKE